MAVLALYLAAILLVQALAAAWVLGAGALHQHRRQGMAVGSPLPSLASVAFSHRGLEPEVAHAQAHATGQRHHHAAQEPDVLLQDPAAEAADAAALALAEIADEIRRQLVRKAAGEMAQKAGMEKLALLEQGRSPKDADIWWAPRARSPPWPECI
jgi:hypothetical protein